ncbi:MAG TPA: hypothetical protein VNK23_03880 [Candidatus Dormibacteraeota bacterium]|nr:hypothetical protein [Candidatus Dormibacteraeota bacterium]
MPTFWSTLDATIVPSVELPPAVPFTSQLTVVVVETVELSSVTVAWNVAVSFSGRLVTVAGEIVTDRTFDDPLPPPHPATQNSPKQAIARTAPRRIPSAPPRRIREKHNWSNQFLRSAFNLHPGFLLVIARFSPWVPAALGDSVMRV